MILVSLAILFLIFQFVFLIGLFFLVRRNRFSQEGSLKESISNIEPLSFAILLPIHSEMDQISLLAERWAQMSRLDSVRLVLLVTQDLAEQAADSIMSLSGKCTMELLVDPTLPSNKSSKLNNFLKYDAGKTDYYFVCDVDTELTSWQFKVIQREAIGADILQVVPISKCRVSSLFEASAHHLRMRRNFLTEYSLSQLSENNRLLRYVFGIRYLAGASVIYSQQAISSIGQFPEQNDDIIMGYRASLLGLKIRTSIAYSLAPWSSPNLREFFRLRRRIWSAAQTRFKTANELNCNTIDKLLFCVLGFLRDNTVDSSLLFVLIGFLISPGFGMLLLCVRITFLVSEVCAYRALANKVEFANTERPPTLIGALGAELLYLSESIYILYCSLFTRSLDAQETSYENTPK